MNEVAQKHPALSELTAFAADELSAERLAVVETHILGCAHCRTVVESLPGDRLARLIRSRAEEATVPPAASMAETFPQAGDSDSAGVNAPYCGPPELAAHARYRVLAKLGEGGMGIVYKAEHRRMERSVALKVISKNLVANPSAVLRFAQEVKAAARLSHPNIVAAHDADEAGGLHFLVMEYVEGISLHRLVQERGALAVGAACDYVRQAALGLQHAFERGMVHRDIKPHNLMLTAEGQVKVLDFGLARFVSQTRSGASLTGSGYLMGTPDFIAPEQARDAHRADVRADIYSLGCTLFYLLAGRPPFPDGTPVQKLAAHVQKAAPRLDKVCSAVPAALAQVVAKMLAKDPSERYQTPAEVAQALAPFAEAQEASALAQGTLVPRAQPAKLTMAATTPTKRYRGFMLAVATALIFLTVGIGVAGITVFRIVTDWGTLIIETSDDHVEVLVKQAGKEVTIFDTKSQQKLTLRSGKYEIELKGAPKGLTLSTGTFELKRGEEVVVKIRLEAPPLPAVGLVRTLLGQGGRIHSVAFHPDGKRALSASQDGVVRVWDLATGAEVAALKGHNGPVFGIAVSPDGAKVLSGGDDKFLRLWDLEKAKEIHKLAGHTDAVYGVEFSSDGKTSLSSSGSRDRSVRHWDLDLGKQLQICQPPAGGTKAVFVSAGKQALSTHYDHFLRMWDLKTGRETSRFAGHQDEVYGVALAPSGLTAASASWDGTVRVWDVRKSKETKCLFGHSDRVLALAYLPDGQRLLSAGDDRTVRLWDVETTEELLRLEGHTLSVHTVAVSADGRFALSGSDDGTIKLWGLPKLQPSSTDKVPLSAPILADWHFARDASGQAVKDDQLLAPHLRVANLSDRSGGQSRGRAWHLEGGKGPRYATYPVSADSPSGADGFALRTGPGYGYVWFPDFRDNTRTNRDFSVWLRIQLQSLTDAPMQAMVSRPGRWGFSVGKDGRLDLRFGSVDDSLRDLLKGKGPDMTPYLRKWVDVGFSFQKNAVGGAEDRVKIYLKGECIGTFQGLANFDQGDHLHLGADGAGDSPCDALYDRVIFFGGALDDAGFRRLSQASVLGPPSPSGPSVALNGLAGIGQVTPIAYPRECRRPGVFAAIQGAGEITLPSVPTSWYVMEAEVELHTKESILTFNNSEPGSGFNVDLGPIWDEDKGKDIVPCRLFNIRPGVTWRLGDHQFKVGERVPLKLVVGDRGARLFYKNRFILECDAWPSDLSLSIVSGPGTSATIHTCSFREVRDEDLVQLKGWAMPRKQLPQPSEKTTQLIKKLLAGLGNQPKETVAFVPATSGMPLTWIPAGQFEMGSRDAERQNERKHPVKIAKGFWMGPFEMTQGEYTAVMGTNPSRVKGSPYLPVDWVSWPDAAEFCKRLTQMERKAGRIPVGYVYRLPTEAEWEYACRAGSEEDFSTADHWNQDNSGERVHEVGESSANKWGLYDMHGNVCEWTHDRWYEYPKNGNNVEVDPSYPVTPQSDVVVRGGAWFWRTNACRSFERERNHQGAGGHCGFRIVLAPLLP